MRPEPSGWGHGSVILYSTETLWSSLVRCQNSSFTEASGILHSNIVIILRISDHTGPVGWPPAFLVGLSTANMMSVLFSTLTRDLSRECSQRAEATASFEDGQPCVGSSLPTTYYSKKPASLGWLISQRTAANGPSASCCCKDIGRTKPTKVLAACHMCQGFVC